MSRQLSDNLDNVTVLIARIEQGLEGQSYDAYVADPVLQDATTYRLSMLGEVMAKLPDDLKDRHPEIPWEKIRGFRNVASHDYFSIVPDMVWEGARSLDPIKTMVREELIRAAVIERQEQDIDKGRDR